MALFGVESPHRVFAILASFFGVAFAFTTPPLDPADERRHMHRTWALSEGHLMPIGRAPGYDHLLPTSLNDLHPPYTLITRTGKRTENREEAVGTECHHDLDELRGNFDIPLSPERRSNYGKTMTYGPASYAGQALIMLIGRKADVSAAALLYLVRLSNLAIWVVVCTIAIRIAPIRRWTLTLLCLTPMATFLAGSLSADPNTTGLCALILALTLRAAYGPEKFVDSRTRAGLLIGCVLLGLVKLGYWPISAIVALIPRRRFRTTRQHASVFFGAPALAIAASAAWLWALQIADTTTDTPDPSLQLLLLLTDPSQFIEALSNTIGVFGVGLGAGFIGILGHLDVFLPDALYFFYAVALLVVTAFDGPNPPTLTTQRRLAWAAIGLGCMLFVAAMVYVGAVRPEAHFLQGLQGRHFIPIAPVLFVAIPSIRRPAPSWMGAAVSVFCAATLALALRTLAVHYFGG